MYVNSLFFIFFFFFSSRRRHTRCGRDWSSDVCSSDLQKDGLVDAYDENAMGVCADECAIEYKFSREDQDAFAIQSYKRSAAAWDAGKFDNEVVPVEVPQRDRKSVV